MREQRVYEFLRRGHVGRENAVYSRHLEHYFDLSDRDLRRIIRSLRQQGYPICSCQRGYYIAKNQKELKDTISRLGGCATGMEKSMHYLEETQMKKNEIRPKKNEEIEEIQIMVFLGGDKSPERLREVAAAVSAIKEFYYRQGFKEKYVGNGIKTYNKL